MTLYSIFTEQYPCIVHVFIIFISYLSIFVSTRICSYASISVCLSVSVSVCLSVCVCLSVYLTIVFILFDIKKNHSLSYTEGNECGLRYTRQEWPSLRNTARNLVTCRVLNVLKVLPNFLFFFFLPIRVFRSNRSLRPRSMHTDLDLLYTHKYVWFEPPWRWKEKYVHATFFHRVGYNLYIMPYYTMAL